MLSRRAATQLFLISLIAGCDSGSDKKASDRKTIAIAYALGGKGDQSYNDAAVPALPELAKTFSIREFSPLTLDDYSKAITVLAAANPTIIFCVGFIYDSFVDKLAAQYPEITFAVLDGAPRAANSLGIQFKVNEASALAGVVAADISKNKRIGFVGGSDIPPINEFLQGYTAGARRLVPEVSLEVAYIGSGAEAFTNASRGKDIALRLIESGVDVLFHAAGGSGNGVIAAAKERGIKAIGVDVDQTHLAPDTVVTNVIKRLDVAILDVATKLQRGEEIGKGVIRLGLAENGVQITASPALSDHAKVTIAALTSEANTRQ